MPAILPLLAIINGAAGVAVTVWQPYEVSLESFTRYEHPTVWRDVELNATFTSGNLSLLTPGFWDGGTTWKLRFSPPTVGVWQFRTVCSDAANTGLHGAGGTFTAVAYAGDNPLFKHGILRPSGTNRYLEHADGTPFYWLGDTHCERS